MFQPDVHHESNSRSCLWVAACSDIIMARRNGDEGKEGHGSLDLHSHFFWTPFWKEQRGTCCRLARITVHLLSGPGASFCTVQIECPVKSPDKVLKNVSRERRRVKVWLNDSSSFHLQRIKNIQKPDVYIPEKSISNACKPEQWGETLILILGLFDSEPVGSRTHQRLSVHATPIRGGLCLQSERDQSSQELFVRGRLRTSCWTDWAQLLREEQQTGSNVEQTHTTSWPCFCAYSDWSRAKRNMLRCSHRHDSGKSLNQPITTPTTPRYKHLRMLCTM